VLGEDLVRSRHVRLGVGGGCAPAHQKPRSKMWAHRLLHLHGSII
jgi:hypothetical protein